MTESSAIEKVLGGRRRWFERRNCQRRIGRRPSRLRSIPRVVLLLLHLPLLPDHRHHCWEKAKSYPPAFSPNAVSKSKKRSCCVPPLPYLRPFDESDLYSPTVRKNLLLQMHQKQRSDRQCDTSACSLPPLQLVSMQTQTRADRCTATGKTQSASWT